MVIFLTGGSGFLGKPIIEALSHEYTIIAPGHRELDLTDEIAVGTMAGLRALVPRAWRAPAFMALSFPAAAGDES